MNAAGYRATADPLLTENPYTNGTAAKRIYSVGVANGGGSWTRPNGIALWHSDDGGQHWSNPRPVHRGDATSPYHDKPSVTTCWYAGCRGEVYVAYTYALCTTCNNELHVARSLDGGMNFTQNVTVAVGPNITATQILSDSSNGALYVIWEDFSNNRIVARSSTDYGNSWNPENVVTSSVALVDQNHLLHNNTEAVSVMMARYNSAAHAINITWHSWRTTAFQNTMIMFASKTATTNWAVQAVQDVDQTNDQFQPALDFDTAGDV